MSRSRDYVHLTDEIDQNFLADIIKNGFEIGQLWREGDFLPNEISLVEWGNQNDLSNFFLIPNPQKTAISSYLNSKLNQREWKEEFHFSPLKTKFIKTEEQLIDVLNEMTSPIVLKSEFGIAGRNHIIIENSSQGWKLQQIKKKLFGFPIFIEEWVGKNRVLDFSTLWDFTESGPIFLGSTEMIVGEDGSFFGIKMSAEREKQLTHILPKSLEIIKTVFNSIEYPYIGPCAMDGFLFSKDSLIQAQIFSEINFRYSMGRILYEIRMRRNIRTEESGILFLSLHKTKSFNEYLWLSRLKEESKTNIFFVTPVRDHKGKLFQTVGIYYEENEKFLPAQNLLGWILEQWNLQMEI